MIIFKAFSALAGLLLVYAGVTEKFAFMLRQRHTGDTRELGIANPLAIVLGICVVVSSVFG